MFGPVNVHFTAPNLVKSSFGAFHKWGTLYNIYILYIPRTSGAAKFQLEVETQVIFIVSSNFGRFQELLIERVCL